MENITDQILELGNGKKYYIVRQALYKGTTYYLGAETTDDEENFTDNFVFFEKIEKDGQEFVQKVTDQNVLEILAKNIRIEE